MTGVTVVVSDGFKWAGPLPDGRADHRTLKREECCDSSL